MTISNRALLPCSRLRSLRCRRQATTAAPCAPRLRIASLSCAPPIFLARRRSVSQSALHWRRPLARSRRARRFWLFRARVRVADLAASFLFLRIVGLRCQRQLRGRGVISASARRASFARSGGEAEPRICFAPRRRKKDTFTYRSGVEREKKGRPSCFIARDGQARPPPMEGKRAAANSNSVHNVFLRRNSY